MTVLLVLFLVSVAVHLYALKTAPTLSENQQTSSGDEDLRPCFR